MIPARCSRLIARRRRRVAGWILAGLGMAAPWSMAGGSPWFPSIAPGSACQVNSVHDADTLRLTCNGEKLKIRLHCIDAPEIEQRPWSEKPR